MTEPSGRLALTVRGDAAGHSTLMAAARKFLDAAPIVADGASEASPCGW